MIYLGIAAVLYSQKRLSAMGLTKADRLDYQPLFLIVSAIMFVSVGVLFLKIKEPKLTKENQDLRRSIPNGISLKRMPPGTRCSPSPSAKVSAFCSRRSPFVRGLQRCDYLVHDLRRKRHGLGPRRRVHVPSSRPAAQSSPYIPVGALASKNRAQEDHPAGRTFYLPHALRSAMCSRRTFLPSTPSCSSSSRSWGLAWAAINVNSLPMVVEMCRAQISASLPAITTPPPWPRRS